MRVDILIPFRHYIQTYLLHAATLRIVVSGQQYLFHLFRLPVRKFRQSALNLFPVAYNHRFTHTLYKVILPYKVPISRSQRLKGKETE